MTRLAFRGRLFERYREIEASPLPDNFKQLIEAAANRYGERVAINAFEVGDTLTFLELRNRVNRLATSLSQLGIQKGSHVAVFLPNRIEFPVTWLAIASLGAVMVPTNTACTSAELDYLYNDGDVEFLVIDTDFISIVEGMQKRPAELVSDHIVIVGDVSERYQNYQILLDQGDPDFATRETVTRHDLLNIQYTSGTTGMPKGCMQTQNYWFVLAHSAACVEPDMNSVLADHPFFYMDPQWMVVFSLLKGACFYLAKGMTVNRFLDWVCTHDIDISYFPKPLLKTPVTDRDKSHGMKKFISGAASGDLIKEAEERFGVPVRQSYGMTEIGAGLMVPAEIPEDGILDTIGYEAPYRELRIVDDKFEDVPVGETGELLVRGEGIFLGYYNKPEANADSFHDDWFRTGDLFTQDENGYYRIVGRVKDMIRRSSENISALEVEYCVVTLPEIIEAAVVAVPDEYRGEEVKLYVRLNDGLSRDVVTPDLIIEYCKAHLAVFKTPRYIEYVEEFPYTPSHKIAKGELKKLKSDLRIGSYDSVDEVWR